jgi:uncharacterized protein with HEPN domain
MPERKSSVLIKDILICIEHIELYTKELSFEEFSKNFMAIEACLYNIQVIGEAVAHLPDEVKEKETQIPWLLIKGMRNRLIHEYFGTDLPVVWHVIKNELPSFKAELERIQSELLQKESK